MKPPAPAVTGILTVLPGDVVLLPIVIVSPITPLTQANRAVRAMQVMNTTFRRVVSEANLIPFFIQPPY